MSWNLVSIVVATHEVKTRMAEHTIAEAEPRAITYGTVATFRIDIFAEGIAELFESIVPNRCDREQVIYSILLIYIHIVYIF